MNDWFRSISAGVRVPIAAALFVALTGCGDSPDAVPIASFDPNRAADQAMEIYDEDQDGHIAGEELEQAAGINAALDRIDTNQDGKVSAEELVERIRAWQGMSIGYMNFNVDFTLDGRPLSGANITFDPEPFLTDAIAPAVGFTTMAGSSMPSVPKEERASPDLPPGIQAGLYLVRVSKIVDGKETIPAKYNTATILGQEVAKDDPAINNKQVAFQLKSGE